MRTIILAALVALALCQARVIETAPAWNGWNNGWNGWNNGAWNGWNGYNNWPVAETIVEAPAWGNRWDPAWNGLNPAWGANTWGANTWGARPANWGWEGAAWNPAWNAGRVVA